MATDESTLLPRPGRAPVGMTAGGAPPPHGEGRRIPWAGLLLLGLAAFACMGVLTQRERLFDNDYDWIAEARSGWMDILARTFRPIPEAWGFQERPVQTLCFKALYACFGYAPTPYYAFKGLLFAGVVCGIVLFCLRAGFGNRAAFTAAGIFALSAPVFSSVLWVSDFELLAQLFMLAAFGGFLALERVDLRSFGRYRFALFQGGIFLLALLGGRTKGSAKLIPAVLLGYLLVYRRDALRRHLPLIGLIALAAVPLLGLLHDPVPPFAPFSEDRSQGWMWKPANLTTLGILLFGNADPLTGTSGGEVVHSLAGTLCPALLWAGLAAAGALLYRRRSARPLSAKARVAVRFTAVWLGVCIVSFSAFPRLPLGFMARYVTGALVPAGILIALLLSRAFDALPAPWTRRAVPLLALVVLAHGAVNFGHIRTTRESLGQIMVATDRAREAVAESVRDATVLLLDLPYGYNRPTDDGNRYVKRIGRARDIDLSQPLYALVQHDDDIGKIDYLSPVRKVRNALRALPNTASGYRVGIRPVQAFHGLTDGLYDRFVYRSSRSFLAILFRITLDPIDPHGSSDTVSERRLAK